MFKAALIPIWIGKNGPVGLCKLSDRPVLIEVDALGAALYGQMVKLTQSSAAVLADDPILLRPDIRVRVSFRFADVEYTLSGLTLTNEDDDNIVFEFDYVTRRQMAIFAGHLKDAGLLQEGDQAAQPAPEEPQAPVKAAKPKHTKAEQRQVRRERPPAGIERRVHRRHELEATVTLVVVDRGIVIKCLLLEISMSGCRLFMDVPVKIPEDTYVEVDFVGRGYPFRMAAKVKVKTDEHVLGLRFEKMTPRIKERLMDLMEELKAKHP